MVGITALLFPWRRRELFTSSPANVRWLGFPVLPVAAVLSLAVIWGLAYLVLAYPPLGITDQFGLPGPWAGILFMAGLVVVGLLIYYISRAVRRSQGINLDLIYSELPPE
jgi:hypothetical protein